MAPIDDGTVWTIELVEAETHEILRSAHVVFPRNIQRVEELASLIHSEFDRLLAHVLPDQLKIYVSHEAFENGESLSPNAALEDVDSRTTNGRRVARWLLCLRARCSWVGQVCDGGGIRAEPYANRLGGHVDPPRPSSAFDLRSFREGTKKTVKLDRSHESRDELRQMLDEVDFLKQHIVFLDGVDDEEDHAMEEMMCTAWLMRNRANRRLVMVTSMIALRKKSVDEDRMMRAREHFVSWTLLEYLEAVEDDGLFEAAKPHLDASSEDEPVDADSKEWRRSLVQSKYYFAGGNARFMFCFPTSVTVSSLTKAVIALVMGGCSPGVVACLFSCFLDICNPGIISRHAGAAIAMYGGPELVKRLTYSFKDSCVAKEGWITEVLLFARIRKGGVTVDNDKRTFGWPHGRFIMTVDNVSQLPTVGWVKPQTYSKGGYDAVFIDQQEGLIRFVQVARAHEGVLRIECFEKFMRWLHQPTSSFAFKTLEIFCVIEFPLTSAGSHFPFAFTEEERVVWVGMETTRDWDQFNWGIHFYLLIQSDLAHFFLTCYIHQASHNTVTSTKAAKPLSKSW